MLNDKDLQIIMSVVCNSPAVNNFIHVVGMIIVENVIMNSKWKVKGVL